MSKPKIGALVPQNRFNRKTVPLVRRDVIRCIHKGVRDQIVDLKAMIRTVPSEQERMVFKLLKARERREGDLPSRITWPPELEGIRG